MKDRSALAIIGLVSAFAFSMLLTIGGLTVFGYLMDGWLNTGVLFTVIGGVLGVFTGIYNLIRQILKLEEKDGKK
jgi:F0F1-type ATP synthase assembly protein I